jgi:macrolide transport system ATP-binding/permease protein
METLWQDLRYSARRLRKKPGFTTVAILSLTLGIGANATIFTLVKAVFFGRVPVADPSRVMAIFSTQQNTGSPLRDFLPSSYLNAQDLQASNNVFSAISMVLRSGADLEVSGQAIGVDLDLVNANFTDVVGVEPFLGRGFRPEEDTALGAHPVALLSYGLWAKQFGADSRVVGSNLRLSKWDYEVVGVMPAAFRNVGYLGSPDLWVPMAMRDQILEGDSRKSWFTHRSFRMLNLIGRLAPGVKLGQARTEMRDIGAALAKAYPAEDSGRGVTLLPIDQTNINPAQRGVFVLAGTLMSAVVGLVLLIACGNVANLLLARAHQRRREWAVRLSLGASRLRLMRQMLTESLLLALAGAALGLVTAYWSRDLLWKLLPGGRPQNLDTSLDARVILFTLGVAVAATLLCGLIPAWQASRTQQLATLKDRFEAGSGAVGRRYGLRGVLVMTQVAFSLIALAAAGLFVHSLMNAQYVDTGFESKHELYLFLDQFTGGLSAAQGLEFYEQAVEHVGALPGVTAAGVSDQAPFTGGLSGTIFPEGVDHGDPRNGRLTPMPKAAPGFFRAAGITLLRGREFTEHDDLEGAKVVIVNQAFADETWPGQDPIGKRVFFHAQDGSDWNAAVVGMVHTIKYQTLGEPPQPLLYVPMHQLYVPNGVIFVRTAGDPNAVATTVAKTVQSLSPGHGLPPVVAVETLIDDVLSAAKLGAQLLAGFGLLAVLLAAVGTYGVMSYSASQRTQEIGIRMALGAEPRDVLRLVLAGGMAMVLGGAAAAFLAMLLLTRSLSRLLYGIGIFDAPSFLASAALLIGVAALACWIPARRAMRVNPMVALRYE